MARIFAVALVACGVATHAFGAPEPGFRHVRSSDDALRARLASAYRRSATLRTLVDALEAASAVVYVEPARQLGGARDGAVLHSATGSRELPVLRVLIRTNLGDTYGTAVIAHELQHVIEVVQGGPVDGADSMTRRFRELDSSATAGQVAFETDAAREVQARVLAELQRRNSYSK
jgi:hypothetical protein